MINGLVRNPIKVSYADDLTSRWRKLAMCKHSLSLELDVFENEGVISQKTIKKAKSDNPDVIFNYLNVRINRINKLIDNDVKPKIIEFYKDFKKKN